jgi:hypothetical protein
MEPEESEEPDAALVDEGDEAPRRRLPLPAFAAVLALAASLAVGELAVPRLLPPGWGVLGRGAAREAGVGPGAAVPAGATVAPTLEALEPRLVEAAVREALEEHFAVKGAYPSSLETLVSNGLMRQRVLDGAAAFGFSYRLGSGGATYSLGAARP